MSENPENRGAAPLPEKAAASNSSKASDTTGPTEGKRPFIPAWLDDAGLSQAEFRIYCNLCRRADKNGIAWPSVDGRNPIDGKPLDTNIISVCGMARRTVWKAIKSLTDKGFLENLGRYKFGTSNRYRVLAPIGANEAPVEDGTIDAIEAPNKSPIGANEAPSFGANGTLLSAQMRPREGSPKKVLQGSESKDIPQIESSELELVLNEPPAVDNAASAEAIYLAYPRKVSKKDGIAAILKAMKRHSAEFLLERTQTYADSIQWQEARFIPHPATWFNGERFNDDPKEWEKPAEPATRNAKTPTPMDEVIRSLGRRHPEWGQDHRHAKRDGEYPEPPVTKLPRL